jgi:hypothetical protein
LDTDKVVVLAEHRDGAAVDCERFRDRRVDGRFGVVAIVVVVIFVVADDID